MELKITTLNATASFVLVVGLAAMAAGLVAGRGRRYEQPAEQPVHQPTVVGAGFVWNGAEWTATVRTDAHGYEVTVTNRSIEAAFSAALDLLD